MGKTGSRRHGFGALAALGLLALLVQACSDNKGPAGPTFPSSQIGTADDAGGVFIIMRANPATIQVGQTTGITVIAQNINGFPLPGRDVQMRVDVGSLEPVSGRTDANGTFITFLTVRSTDAASIPSCTVTAEAFISGARQTLPVTVVGCTVPTTPTIAEPTSGSGSTTGS